MDTDMEWLSLNWRKYRAGQLSKSNRRTVLLLFEYDFDYFPSLVEIRNSLIKAQVYQLNSIEDQFENLNTFE